MPQRAGGGPGGAGALPYPAKKYELFENGRKKSIFGIIVHRLLPGCCCKLLCCDFKSLQSGLSARKHSSAEDGLGQNFVTFFLKCQQFEDGKTCLFLLGA